MVERAGAAAPPAAPAGGARCTTWQRTSSRSTSRIRSASYERARREQPVFFSEELGFWVVTRYDDIRAIFKDPATFSSENTQATYKPRPPEIQAILDDGEFTAYSGLSARASPRTTPACAASSRRPSRRGASPCSSRRSSRSPRACSTPSTTRGPFDLVVDARPTSCPRSSSSACSACPTRTSPTSRSGRPAASRSTSATSPIEEQEEHARQPRALLALLPGARASRASTTRATTCPSRPRAHLPRGRPLALHRGDRGGLVHSQLTAGPRDDELAARRRPQGPADPARALGGPLRRPRARSRRRVEEMLRIVDAGVRLAAPDEEAGDASATSTSPRARSVLLLLGSANHDETMFERPRGHRPRPRERPQPPRLRPRHPLLPRRAAGAAGGPGRARGAHPAAAGLRLVDGQIFEYPPNTTFRAPTRVLVERRPAPATSSPSTAAAATRSRGWAARRRASDDAAGRVPGPRRLRGDDPRVPRDAGRDVAGRISRDLAALDTDDVTALEAAAAGCASWWRPRRCRRRRGRDPRRLRGARRRRPGRGALERDGGGRRRGQLRRPAGHLPVGRRRRRGPRRTSAAAGRSLFSAALDRLPRATAGSRTTTCRWASPSSGWSQARRRGRGDDAEPRQRRPLEDRDRGELRARRERRRRHRDAGQLPRRQGRCSRSSRRRSAARRSSSSPTSPAGCVTELEVEEERRAQPALSGDEAQAGRGAGQARRAAPTACPQDIEWAVDGERADGPTRPAAEPSRDGLEPRAPQSRPSSLKPTRHAEPRRAP